MNRVTLICFFAATLTLSAGCCGPLWQAGGCCDNGCSGPVSFGHAACGDGCGDCEGCGELYVDPWINHPADCCDPCDACGNFNGQSCGKCRSVFTGVKSLWGYRCDDGCGTGCDSCGSGSCGGGCESSGCSSCGTGDCGCGNSYGHVSSPQHGGVVNGDVVLGEGETIVQTAPRIHQSGPRTAKQIFRSRSPSQPRPTLAY